MYKKNSILDRPRRPPSARNRESAPIEHERAVDKQNRLARGSASPRWTALVRGTPGPIPNVCVRRSTTRFTVCRPWWARKGWKRRFAPTSTFAAASRRCGAVGPRRNYPAEDPRGGGVARVPGTGREPASPCRPASPGTRSRAAGPPDRHPGGRPQRPEHAAQARAAAGRLDGVSTPSTTGGS